MTCEEFRRMSIEQDPRTATNAEVAAHFQHATSCRACSAFLDQAELPDDKDGSLARKAIQVIEDPEGLCAE